MANEISLTASLSVFKAAVMANSAGLSATSAQFTQSGSGISEGVLLVGTSATAIPLASLTSLGWAAFYNADTVNYCTIRNGSGGADLVQLAPGGYAFFQLVATAVPYAVANTAAVYLQYFIASA